MADNNQREDLGRELKFKVILLGNPNVGKSSIIRRCVSDDFEDVREPTTRVSESRAVILLQNNIEIVLEIWDAPGEYEPTEYRPDFYKNVDAIVLTYDVTNEESFKFIPNMMNELREKCNKPVENVAIFIAGNKAELPITALAVDLNDVEIFSKNNNAVQVRTSAKVSSNIRFLFDTIAVKAYGNFIAEEKRQKEAEEKEKTDRQNAEREKNEREKKEREKKERERQKREKEQKEKGCNIS